MTDVVVLYSVAVARVAVTILIEVAVAVVEAIVAVRVDVVCQISQQLILHQQQARKTYRYSRQVQ